MRTVLSVDTTGEIHLDEDVTHREITGDKLTVNTKKGKHNSTGYPTFFTDDRNWVRGNTHFQDEVEIAGSTKVQKNLVVGGKGTQLDANAGKSRIVGHTEVDGTLVVKGITHSKNRVCFENGQCTTSAPRCRVVTSKHAHLGNHEHNFRTPELMQGKPVKCASTEYMTSMELRKHPHDGKSIQLQATCCSLPWVDAPKPQPQTPHGSCHAGPKAGPWGGICKSLKTKDHCNRSAICQWR